MGLCDFLQPGKKAMFSGGSGETIGTAVILNTTRSSVGIAAESEFISTQCGERNKDWKKQKQALLWQGDKPFDLITIELSDGKTRNFYFDVSQFFGKP